MTHTGFRWATLACLLLCAASLLASEHNGQVQFAGLPVPGAQITASQAARKITAITDAKGFYHFAGLADGNWNLRIEMSCFSPIVRDIVVAPGAPGAIWELQLLPFSEIQTAAGSTLTTTVKPVEKPAEIAAAAAAAKKTAAKGKPGATPPATAAAAKGGFQQAGLRASTDTSKLPEDKSPPQTPTNGGTGEFNQSAADGFLVNGSVNNGAASAFAQSAAFGNNRNGGKSAYSGAVSVTIDNAYVDARAYSLTGQNTPRAPYNLASGNISFGGPLKIPHVLKPSRFPPNFFLGYQWTRNRNASTQTALMPTLAQRAGDLSGLKFVDPSSGLPFANNLIPDTRISPQAKALLNYYPAPNFAQNSRYNYQVPLVGGNDVDGVQAFVNKTLSMANQFSGTFGWQRTNTTTPTLFGFTDNSSSGGMMTNVSWSHRFNTHFFGRAGVQFSRGQSRSTPYFANRTNVSAAANIFGNNQDPQNWGPPALSFSSGFAGLSDGLQSLYRNQTVNYSASAYYNKKSHNLSVGTDYRRQQLNELSQQNPRGRFGFTGAYSGNDFADFLLGVPDTSAIAFGNADKYFRSQAYDAYFTDDWRLNSKLTFNLGMRWEYGTPITELYGRLVNLDVAPGFGPVAAVVASSPTGKLTGKSYADSLLDPDKHEWQPRLAIAWRPFLASSVIVRMGYGVYYNTSVYQAIAQQMAQQSPLSKSLSVQNTKDNPLTLANGFLASPNITTNTYAVDPNFHVGYAHNWNASIQRDLPGSLVMTATYLGIKGTRQQQEFLPNTVPNGALQPCATCASGYAYLTSNGNSTRESGSLQLRRRLHNGFTASLQYTYSKSIDDAGLGGRGQGSVVIAQNWLNLAGERGLSTFDQRHLLNLSAQYTTGMGKAGGTLLSGWKGALYKEWTFSTQINAGTGLPQSPIYISAVGGTGVTGTIRPLYTGASLYSAPSGFYLNPAAYAAPLPGQWGNAARDSITGPAQFSLNASGSRTFRLTDRFNGDFRIEASNALNHVNYSSWNTVVNGQQFGLPVSANAMRRVQATLRVRF